MSTKKRRIKCKFCDFICYDAGDYVSHLEKKHYEQVPEDMRNDIWQFAYFLRTGRTHGSCVVCKKDTTWNSKTKKYNRFCDNPECKEKYRELFKKRMIGKYGKTTLLNDPDQQKKMLANRKISGVYTWRDRVHESTYTGTYEKSFLEFLDTIMDFDPEDLFAPSPHIYYYEYDGRKRFYIPDFFIPSLELEVEIKDEGNTHPHLEVDRKKEYLKDKVITTGHYNYLKITGKHNEHFLKYLDIVKNKFMNGDNSKTYIL